MADVLYLKDGKTETIFTVRHFEELIEKYMGDDALRYFRELLDECEEEIEELKAEYEEKLDLLREKVKAAEESQYDERKP